MHGLKHIEKIREYCDYLEKHLKAVEWAWKTLQEVCSREPFIHDDFLFLAIESNVRNHDLSKFSIHEFIQYQRKFFPVDDIECPDPVFECAWEHHKQENRHHWENWTKLQLNDYESIIHCIHMVIDWMAMSKTLGGTTREFYEKNKDKIELPQWAIDFCYDIFDQIDGIEEENENKVK